MKDFKEFVTEAPKSDDSSYKTYQTNLKNALSELNSLVEYGRKMKMDNKQLNPLLDAIKSIHTGDDAIRVAYEESINPTEPEEEKETPKKW